MTTNTLSTQFAKMGQKLASRVVCYFNGQHLYKLTAEPDGIHPKQVKPWLLVLARSCYQEQVNSYPIKSVRELKQLLELQRPSGLLIRYFIGPYENNQRWVHEIAIDAAYAATVEQARFVVPETLLLAKFAPIGFTTIALKPPQSNALPTVGQQAPLYLWFHRGPQQSAAVLQGGLLTNDVAARVAMGVHSAEASDTWSFGDYLRRLSEHWWRLPASWWLASRNGAQGEKSSLPWAAMLSVSVAMVLVYACLSSGYLHFANQWRSKEILNLSSEVMQHLVAREQLEGDLDKLKMLAAVSAFNTEQLFAWNIVAFLKQKEITLNQVSGDLNTIEVGGEVESATELVAQLNELPGVIQVEFIAPVRRGHRGEMFRLRIQLVAN